MTYYGSAEGGRRGDTQSTTALNINTNEVTSAYVFNSVLSQDDAIAMNKAAITAAKAVAEPATATLSLLALAGLAARRRRK